MRRHTVALLLLRLRPWAAFTLVPYRAWKHPWRLAKLAGDDPQLAGLAPDSRFNQSSKVAWLPAAADDTAEAVALRTNFYGRGGTLEFVHVHKCGGLTFSHVAPRFVCPLADGPAPCGGCVSPWGYRNHPKTLGAWAGETCGAPCCVMRQRPSLPALLDAWPFDARPRFVSAYEEFDAFALPWVVGATFKAVMVRDPYARFLSDVQFECRMGRAADVPTAAASLARNDTLARRRAARNRIAADVVHRSALGDSGDDGARLAGERWAAAEAGLRAFAFVGVVEHFERSMCLLARTASREGAAVHAVAVRLFEARWDLAEAEGWGAANASAAAAAGAAGDDDYASDAADDHEAPGDARADGAARAAARAAPGAARRRRAAAFGAAFAATTAWLRPRR
ncbi:decanoate-CoA ligase [Aureococcus anophagefferens]|nr:decanoate-CoA ligase [Aureococcus anophagefferens]